MHSRFESGFVHKNGRLAQLVQSTSFTPRGSGVRISHRPLKASHYWGVFFIWAILFTYYIHQHWVNFMLAITIIWIIELGNIKDLLVQQMIENWFFRRL